MFEESPKEEKTKVMLPDYAEQRIENTIRYFFTYHKNKDKDDFKTLAELIIKDLLI